MKHSQPDRIQHVVVLVQIVHVQINFPIGLGHSIHIRRHGKGFKGGKLRVSLQQSTICDQRQHCESERGSQFYFRSKIHHYSNKTTKYRLYNETQVARFLKFEQFANIL